MKKVLASVVAAASVGMSGAVVPERSMAADYPSFLTGVIVPLVTPYRGPNGEEVDHKALRALTKRLCRTRATALFAVSGTGQWKLLSFDERKRVLETCIRAARGKKPVLAGVGSPANVEEVIEMARFAEGAGAAAVVAVTPSFVRETQPAFNGRRRIWDQAPLIDYYTQISQAVSCPVVIYDPEGEIEPQTLRRLIESRPNITGIKVRPRKDPSLFPSMVEAAQGKAAVICGSENVALHAIQQGAVGVIGGGFNVYPDLGAELIEAVAKNQWSRADQLQRTIVEANGKLEQLGGGAQGVKKILNDVVGVSMSPVNRGDTFRPESHPGEHDAIVAYFRKLLR